MSKQLCPQSFCGFDFDDLRRRIKEEHDFLPIRHRDDVGQSDSNQTLLIVLVVKLFVW
ncbi:MAG: hypothetical protein ACR2RB_19880 [Gammaproteobacteria bacterium]